MTRIPTGPRGAVGTQMGTGRAESMRSLTLGLPTPSSVFLPTPWKGAFTGVPPGAPCRSRLGLVPTGQTSRAGGSQGREGGKGHRKASEVGSRHSPASLLSYHSRPQLRRVEAPGECMLTLLSSSSLRG